MFGRYVPGFSLLRISALIIFASALWGAAPSIPADPRPCGPGSATYLKTRLAIWQQRMNLADWQVTIVMSHPSELKPKTLGNVHWDSAKKTAVIHVLDASDYQMGCPDMLDDMEMTVVHELVHLELSSLPRSTASRHEEELAVNRIADALLKLDRQSVVGESRQDTASNRQGAPAAAQ